MPATERQREALRNARAKRSEKLAKKKLRKFTIPRPEPVDAAPVTTAETAPADETAPASPQSETAPAPAQSHAGGDASEQSFAAAAPTEGAAMGPEPTDAEARIEPAKPDESPDERRARYARNRVAIGRAAPFHYQIHRGPTAWGLRLLMQGLLGVDASKAKVLAMRTTPRGDVEPVMCTVDKAIALALSEAGAYAFGTGSLDHPLGPAALTLVGCMTAILAAKFGATSSAENGDMKNDFEAVDIGRLTAAATAR